MRISPSEPIPVSRLQIAAVWAVVIEISSEGSKTRTKSFLDVRNEEELPKINLKNQIQIPIKNLENEIKKLDKNQMIYVFCQSGIRSKIAVEILQKYQFKNVKSIAGGAFGPLAWGLLSSSGLGQQGAYIVMLPCYLFILFYAVKGHKLTRWK